METTTVSPRLPRALVEDLRRLARKTGMKQERLIAACIREALPAIEGRWDRAMDSEG